MSLDEPEKGDDPFALGHSSATERWSGTRRGLYGVLGRLLWHNRVIGIELCQPAAQGFVQLLLQYACHPQQRERWEDIVTLSEAETATVRELWAKRELNTAVKLPALAGAGAKEIVFFGASDASSKNPAIGHI